MPVGRPLEGTPGTLLWHCARCSVSLFDRETYIEEPWVTPSTTARPTDPSHYKRLDPEPFDVIERWGLSFCLGCAMKYISRAGHKTQPGKGPNESAIEDLEKAIVYLKREISQRSK